MSSPRNEIPAHYDLKETGLQNLIHDLCLKNDDDQNRDILTKALAGTYSDLGSKHIFPIMLLYEDLSQAQYSDLATLVYTGRYDHDFGPKAKTNHPDFIQANKSYGNQKRRFQKQLGFITSWIRTDLEEATNTHVSPSPK